MRAPYSASFRARATAIGFAAVLMWAFLAFLTVRTGEVPPFLLTALTFSIGGATGLAWLGLTGRWRDLRQRPAPYVLGVSGLFLYHALYFAALDRAPAVEASLIAYLWPLLIVLFASLLPGERLRARHLLGACLGFAGAALIVTKGRDLSVDPAFLPGYAAALACAFVWSGYSVLSRRLGAVPTGVVAVSCLGTAALAAVAHIASGEAFVLPASAAAWLAVLGLGLFPVGAAFYCWDHGMKRGDIQFLGIAAFAAPLLSTLVLVAAGEAAADRMLLFAALLVAGGAALAGFERGGSGA